MGKTVFIPLTDDLLYEHPEWILGPVVPFSQHARRISVQFAATTHGLDTKTKFESAGVNPGEPFKAGEDFPLAGRNAALV